MSLYELMSKGYFPKELPPIFTTNNYANHLITCTNIEKPSKEFSKGVKFYIPKEKHFKRLITITNPIHQYHLTKHLVDNYKIVEDIFRVSTCSYSTPDFKNTEQRSIVTTKSYNDYIKDRVIKSCGSRYLLITDVSRFYQTIYTHSIPWAIDGKEKSKQSKGKKTFANDLDFYLRNLQDQQTLGIPTGPDTSRIISEILLCDIDRLLLEKFPDISFLRYLDDYTIPCKDINSAKEILNELTRIFNKYELEINESKTDIVELPIELEQEWVALLKSKKISNTPQEQQQDLISYFNLAYNLYKKKPSKNVLHYALIEKLPVKIYPENWQLFESIILQCTVYEPRVIPLVGRILYTYKKMGYTLHKELIRETLLGNIKEKIDNYNSFEVVWGIFILCQLDIEINKDLSCFHYSTDILFFTTMLYAMEKGNYKGKIPKAELQRYMVSDGLFSDSWLLSYESNIHGWLNHKKGKDICTQDAFYNQLKNASVSFMDLDAKYKVISDKYLMYKDDEESEEIDTTELLYGEPDDLYTDEDEEWEEALRDFGEDD